MTFASDILYSFISSGSLQCSVLELLLTDGVSSKPGISCLHCRCYRPAIPLRWWVWAWPGHVPRCCAHSQEAMRCWWGVSQG